MKSLKYRMIQDNTSIDGSTVDAQVDHDSEGDTASDAERAAEQARLILLLLDDML
jgi:hypothetical protein